MSFEIQPRDIVKGRLLPGESYETIKWSVTDFCVKANEVIAAWLENATPVYGGGQFWGPKHPGSDDTHKAKIVCIEMLIATKPCLHRNIQSEDVNHVRCIDCGRYLVAEWHVDDARN